MDFFDMLGPLLLFFAITIALRFVIGGIISLSSGRSFEKDSWQQAVLNGISEFSDGIIAFIFSRSYTDSWNEIEELFCTIFTIGAVVSLVVGFIWLLVAVKRKSEAEDDENRNMRAGVAQGSPTKRAKAEVMETRTGRVIFRLENGQQLMLNTSLNNYKVGQVGMLMWQGSRALAFDRLPVAAQQPKPAEQLEKSEMQLIRCPVCDTEQKAGRKFCFRCGHTFTPEESSPTPAQPARPIPPVAEQKPKEETAHGFCTECGTKLEPGMKFCCGCGKALTPPEPTVFCHNCGTKQTYGDGKCTSCGTQLVKKD